MCPVLFVFIPLSRFDIIIKAKKYYDKPPLRFSPYKSLIFISKILGIKFIYNIYFIITLIAEVVGREGSSGSSQSRRRGFIPPVLFLFFYLFFQIPPVKKIDR